MAQNEDITPEDLVDRLGRAPAGIALASLYELRSAYNRGRTTSGVLHWIENRLKQDHRIGLAVASYDEPSQDQDAYIFRLDEPIGALITAAQNPSEGGLRRLREVASAAGAAVRADSELSAVKAALDDATSALNAYLGGDGNS